MDDINFKMFGSQILIISGDSVEILTYVPFVFNWLKCKIYFCYYANIHVFTGIRYIMTVC